MNTGSFFNWFQFLLSFALVIGLLLAALWGLKRIQKIPGGANRKDQQIEILESLSLGPRQKLLLVRVNNDQVLVGISAGQMQPLHASNSNLPR